MKNPFRSTPIPFGGTTIHIPGMRPVAPLHQGLRLKGRAVVKPHLMVLHLFGLAFFLVAGIAGPAVAIDQGAIAPVLAALAWVLVAALTTAAFVRLYRNSWTRVLDIELTADALHVDGERIPRTSVRDFQILDTYLTGGGDDTPAQQWAVVGLQSADQARILGHFPLAQARKAVAGLNTALGLTRSPVLA